MDNIILWLHETWGGEFCYTLLFSMLPVVELRGGIPLGAGMGLPLPLAVLAAVIGNMLPVPFIILFTRRIFFWLQGNIPPLRGLLERMERRVESKKELVLRYQFWGLMLLVAVPLPGDGGLDGGHGGGGHGPADEAGPAGHPRRRAYRRRHCVRRYHGPLFPVAPLSNPNRPAYTGVSKLASRLGGGTEGLMQLWQDGLIAMLAAVGLASLMWTVVRAVMFSRPEAQRDVLVLIPAQGDGENLERQVRQLSCLRCEQGAPGRILLVDCGLSEEGRKLAGLLSREDRWVSVCGKEEIGNYL